MNKQIISTIKTYIIVILAVILIIISIKSLWSLNSIKSKDRENIETETYNEKEEIEIDEIDEIDLSYTDPIQVELKAGKYKVGGIRLGDDINVGTYNIYAKEGYGLITGNLSQGYISETIGYSSHIGYTETYEGIYLAKDDEFTIEGKCILIFEPVE